ncbi:zinc finger protein 883-like isoform X3 [Ornithodoros turicata]|uniref:zinc finger protein 883-like isoform X3 n=1 Tax=Ornithodoros turicata TaxID=34597 RepID=UPI0031391BE1
MQLSPEFSGHLVRVQLAPLGSECLQEEGQVQQQHCDVYPSGGDSYGGMTRMCHIKQEPREESSTEHPITVVKTEPYSVAILAGQEHMGHSCDSVSERAGESSCMLHNEDQPRATCDRASLGCTSSNPQFKVCTATVEPQFVNAALVTTNSQPTDQPSDLRETQVAGKSSTFGEESDKLYRCMACISSMCKGNLCCAEFVETTHTSERPYKCDVCPAVFSVNGNRSRHTRTHTGEKPHKCDVCCAEFSERSKLQRHMRTHTGEKPYKCDLCPSEFSSGTNLSRHRLIHTGEKPYKCDLCRAQFRKSTMLQQHKRTHTSERPYKCDLCPAEFSQSGHLSRHKRTHTGEKPYKCDLCCSEFSESMKLREHKRTHTGEKPCKCNLCPAEFSHRTSLSRHKRTHTEEKPYKCDLCHAEFRESQKLRYHKRTHTGILCPCARRPAHPSWTLRICMRQWISISFVQNNHMSRLR